MPIYRYECSACGRRCEEIHSIGDAPPASGCCSVAQRRLMPRRVRGRVLEPGQAQAEARAEEAGELQAAALRSADPPQREATPWDIPPASWSGPATSRAEVDARKRDTVEAMASWQTRSLEADGVEYGAAKRKAERHQQQIIAQAED